MTNESLTKKERKRAIRAQRKASAQRKKWVTNFVLILIAVGVTAAVYWPRPAAPEVAQVRLVDQPSIGPADAPVVLIEFGDFTCSSCKLVHQSGVLHELVSKYEGLVRLEWHDLPIITPDSPKAAQAGQCAHDQGLFWEYLDRVYNEPGSSYTNAAPDKLQVYAEDVGLDMAAFNTCLDTSQHQATVDYDLQFARSLGLNGTPSFQINGQAVFMGQSESGELDTTAMAAIIEAELAAQK